MIVTFYSYKGGVGRSMALANVAEWYRLRGLKVVMIDWDLEAPGLESFFTADKAEREAMQGKLGLIDLIATYRDVFPGLARPTSAAGGTTPSAEAATQSKVNEPFITLLDDALPPIKHMLVPIRSRASSSASSEGGLWLLPAGCRNEARFDAYAETVQQFDWGELYAKYEGEAYFEWMRRQLLDPELADVVLIDSRTGVAEMSGVCTRQLADVVVILSAPNDQNLDGVARMARSFVRTDLKEARGGRPIELIMVPARIHVTEGRPIDLFEAKFHERLDRYRPQAFERVGTSFERLRVPYISAYAFEERLAVGDPEGVKALQQAYAELATHVALLAPPKSALRRQCAEALKDSFGLPTVVVTLLDKTHEAQAEVLRERLDAAGLLTLPLSSAPEAAIQDVARRKGAPGVSTQIAVVLTRTARYAPRVRDLWRRAREQGLCLCFVAPAEIQPIANDVLAIPRGARLFDPEREFDELLGLLQSPCQARPVPMLAPPVLPTFVTRGPLLARIKALVLADPGTSPRAPVALVGLGGYGKTSLAKALCQEDDVVDRFDDGILWMSLGPEADLREALAKQVLAFEGEPTANLDLAEAERRLSEHLTARRCLVVVDDLCDPAHLERIPTGGPGCQTLITTRSRDVVAKASAQIVEVGGLSPLEARRFVSVQLTLKDPDAAQEIDALASALGGSPLALQLANQALSARHQVGVHAQAGLLELRTGLEREGLAAIDPGLSSNPENSILAVMQLATERLTPQDRACLSALAALPVGSPVKLAEVAAATKQAAEPSQAMVRRLATASLVDFDAVSGEVHIHPLTHAFFRSLQQGEAAANQTRILRATPAGFSIYVSYRRQDSGHQVRMILSRFATEFGSRSVYSDQDIPVGADFRQFIERRLEEASVVVVVIGPKWLGPGRGFDDPNDFVIIEISTALQRGVTLIPVLVGGAAMPPPDGLPIALRPLTRLQALAISDLQFNQGMDTLVKVIAQVPASPPTKVIAQVPASPPTVAKGRTRTLIWAALAIAALVGGGAWLWTRPGDTMGLPEFARAETYFFGRGVQQDYVEAAKWYLQSAQQGYPSAQNALGRMYEGGQGVPKDVQLARTWYERAAAQGHPDAKAALARLDKQASAPS